MPGPTAWPQQFQVINTGAQTITTTSETVVATLAGVNSRSQGAQVSLFGACCFAVAAATTATTIRLRIGSLTGTLLGAAQPIGSVAGQVTAADGAVAAVDTPAGEYAGQTYVLTVQATAAGANWNVTFASLQAFV